jgi:hypothetical protein
MHWYNFFISHIKKADFKKINELVLKYWLKKVTNRNKIHTRRPSVVFSPRSPDTAAGRRLFGRNPTPYPVVMEVPGNPAPSLEDSSGTADCRFVSSLISFVHFFVNWGFPSRWRRRTPTRLRWVVLPAAASYESYLLLPWGVVGRRGISRAGLAPRSGACRAAARPA